MPILNASTINFLIKFYNRVYGLIYGILRNLFVLEDLIKE